MERLLITEPEIPDFGDLSNQKVHRYTFKRKAAVFPGTPACLLHGFSDSTILQAQLWFCLLPGGCLQEQPPPPPSASQSYLSCTWWPRKFCICYKVLMLIPKGIEKQGPSYLSELVTLYSAGHRLRSTDTGLCASSILKCVTLGGRSFSHCTRGPQCLQAVSALLPSLWLKSKLKTQLCLSAGS